MDRTKRRKSITLKIAVMLGVAAVVLLCTKGIPLKAREMKLAVKEINYSNSTITLYSPNGDSEVYFSDSKKSKWETVPGGIDRNGLITMNLSWVSVTSNYTLTFKGDRSTEVLTVKLPKQVTNFKASFQMAKGTMSFSNTSGRPVEWRKNGTYIWKTVNMATINQELEYLYNNGATVYFRLAPVNGDGNSVGMRASKEVSVTIKKKSDAPKVTIDGSKFTIDSVGGLVYRIVNPDGSTSDWLSPKSSSLKLSEVAAEAMYRQGAEQKQVILQFRKKATASVQVSSVATIVVPVQDAAPDIVKDNISVTYSGSSTIQLQVKAAGASTPFEYTIVKENESLNYSDTVWIPITSDDAVTIDAKKAPEGSHIYLRRKSTGTDDKFKLASDVVCLTGNKPLEYPEGVQTEQLTMLVSIAGICNPENSSGNLEFILYSAYRTTVDTIQFRDSYGKQKGAVLCKSSVSRNTASTGEDDRYIITTKITSTSELDKVTDEVLYADITLKNTDKIESTEDNGVILYLYPASYVHNPDGDEYTTAFERLHSSKDQNDNDEFTFVIDMGTEALVNRNDIDALTAEPTLVKAIQYDGYTLLQGTDYTVSYDSYINDRTQESIRTAEVTVNVKAFENQPDIENFDKAIPMVITLNNGETLKDSVTIKLIRTAALREAPIAWSILEGSLPETKIITKTNTDGSTTQEAVEVTTYELTMDVFDKKYNVGVSDVTWGGYSVLKSAVVSDGVITIQLSNPKINRLTTDETTTNNLEFELSNGYTIRTGCKLTILNNK